MQTVMIVSPHLDDAVLSCGQLLAALPRMAGLVVTVFAGTPNNGRLATDFDLKCGFKSAEIAMGARRAEDHRAVTAVGARHKHLAFVDSQYGEPMPSDDDIAAALHAVFDPDPSIALVVGPLGLQHIDHRRVASGFQLFASTVRTAQRWLYEELPYRVQWPEQVPDALAEVRQRFRPSLEALGGGPLSAKNKAVGHYRSQLWGLDGHSHLVAERYWLLHDKEE